MNVSFFLPMQTREGKVIPGVKPTKDINFESYLADIREGTWQDTVINYRAGRVAKEASPGITPSGTFSYRSVSNLLQHSGVIAMDFDKKDNDEFPADEVGADPYTLAMHRSISGFGWVVYVRIDPDRHTDAYLALERYFAESYHLVADLACKDVTRFRFVSFDPELYHNPTAKVWKKYLPKKQIQPLNKTYVHTEKDIEHVINQLNYKGVSIAESYADWIKIGMGLAGTYGESGREYFHQISAISAKYDPDNANKKYDNFLKTSGIKATVASVFWLAQQVGVEIKTQRTAHIERVFKMQMRVVGSNGGHKDKQAASETAVKILCDLDGVEGDDVDQIGAQVAMLPNDELNEDDSGDLIANIKEFLRTYNMQFNEVTRNIEIEGEPWTDREFNSIYVKSLEVMGLKTKGRQITKDLLISIIDSDFTQAYHPLRDFFVKNANLKPKGEIEKLLGCIKMEPMNMAGTPVPGAAYLDTYARKWLLSCVASWHGTHSVMMLVLCGGQNLGKTKFFRNLLPESIRHYFADFSMDRSKDFELLLTQKALVCDDEFEGKATSEYKYLKSLLSKQTFSIRRPYGKITEDLQRLSVFCGTSNEETILNDPTGNRRIIPVPVVSIDWEAYEAIDKDALWMESYQEWKTCGDWWMLTKEEIAALNEMTVRNNQIMQEEEAFFMFFKKPTENGVSEFLTNTEIKNLIEEGSSLKISTMRLGLALTKNRFYKIMKRIDGSVRMVYEVERRF